MRMLFRSFACCFVLLIFSCQKKPSDRLVNVLGYKQHILDLGDGAPVVIFISGSGDDLSSFTTTQNKVSTFTKTISYDRPGIGKSEAPDSVRTLDREANELDQLLETEHIKKPFILAGHAAGAMIARYYANLYKHNVCGLILIDPAHEDFFSRLANTRRTVNELRSLDSLRHYVDPAALPGVKREARFRDGWYRLIRGIKLPNNIPVTVIASAKWEAKYGFTQNDMQIKIGLIRSWSNTAPQIKIVVTDKSGSYVHQDEPDLVASEIRLVVEKLRSK